MAVLINTNTSASFAALNLGRSSGLLARSLARLSSGSRLSETSDDPGGMGVGFKLATAIKRTDATARNVSNALSFLQTQAGSLRSASAVVDRMSELAALAGDVTKTSSDVQQYALEFDRLYNELGKLSDDSFNGISLFSQSGASGHLTVLLAQDASQQMKIDQSDLAGRVGNLTALRSLTGTKVSKVTKAIQELAGLLATNGAQASRLQFALDSLNTSQVNLEAANSRILDVDVASETTKLARANILVQSGAAMLSQANAASQIALRLLQ